MWHSFFYSKGFSCITPIFGNHRLDNDDDIEDEDVFVRYLAINKQGFKVLYEGGGSHMTCILLRKSRVERNQCDCVKRHGSKVVSSERKERGFLTEISTWSPSRACGGFYDIQTKGKRSGRLFLFDVCVIVKANCSQLAYICKLKFVGSHRICNAMPILTSSQVGISQECTRNKIKDARPCGR